MSKIEYLIAERSTSGYGGYEQYYTSKYGYLFKGDFFRCVGSDGWELVSDNGNQLKFKRVVEDELDTYDSYDEFSNEENDCSEDIHELRDTIAQMAKCISQLDNELDEARRREVMLIAMVQALAEKVMPGDPFVEAFNRRLDPDGEIGRVKAAADAAQKTKRTPGGANVAVAEKLVAEAVRGQDPTSNAMGILVAVLGLGRMLPGTSANDHCRQMIEGMHRYYQKNSSIKLQKCFTDAFSMMAVYFSSSQTISDLNASLKKPLTGASAAEAFLTAVEIELEFECQNASDFSLEDVEGLVNTYVSRVNEDAVLADDSELISVANEHITSIREKYDLDISDFTQEEYITLDFGLVDDEEAMCEESDDFEICDGELIHYYGDNSHVIVPDGIRMIYNRAFYGCESLESISIPKSVQTIGNHAFAGCCSLKSVSIPEGLEKIGVRAFYRCESLENISLPESLTTIDSEAFDDSENVTIQAPAGSYAAKFAKRHKIKFEPLD